MSNELDDPFAPTELHGFEGTLLDPNWWEVRRKRLEELGRPALWYWEEESQPYCQDQLKWQEIVAQIKAEMDPRMRKALGWE
jgi:hypothetical protein